MWHYGAEVISGATSAKFRQSANIARLPINNTLTKFKISTQPNFFQTWINSPGSYGPKRMLSMCTDWHGDRALHHGPPLHVIRTWLGKLEHNQDLGATRALQSQGSQIIGCRRRYETQPFHSLFAVNDKQVIVL